MKLIIHSLDELRELSALIVAADERKLFTAKDVAAEMLRKPHIEREMLHTSHKQSEGGRDASAGVAGAPAEPTAEAVENSPEDQQIDSAGKPWDERIHSSTKAKNKDGTRRIKRGVSHDLLASVAGEVATPEPEPEPEPTAITAEADSASVSETAGDYSALIAAASAAAGDQSDNLVSLLDAAKGFIGTHSTSAFNRLKSAVVPGDGPSGKPIPQLTPAERRLMMAALELHDAYVS